MRRFRTRLFLAFVVLFGLSALSIGAFMVHLVKDSHLKALRAGMLRELNLIVSGTEWPASSAPPEAKRAALQEKAAFFKELTGARTTFIDADGTVLADSDSDPETMDNHLNREEIRLALAEGVGYAVRFSDTVRRDMLNAALPIFVDGGELAGFVRMGVSLADIEAVTGRMWAFIVSGLLAFFVIAGLISFRIAHGLAKPIMKATEAARQITRMNYGVRVQPAGSEEIRQLAEAINTMADSLRSQMSRIQAEESKLKSVLDNVVSGVMLIGRDGAIAMLNRQAEAILGFAAHELAGRPFDECHLHAGLTGLIRDCFEKREHIRDELVFYYPGERVLETHLVPMPIQGEFGGIVIVLHDITAVRRLERMRSEFVANVSHELRTPLTAVKGFAETLLAGALEDKETARQFLQIIHDESRRLSRLIEDTLELSDIESGRAPLEFSPIRLETFVADTLEMIRREAEKKGITLSHKVTGDPHIEADEDRLRQILLNLLSNAINYTPEGGRVDVVVETVTAGKTAAAETVSEAAGSEASAVGPAAGEGQAASSPEDEKVRITVTDTGIGIPKKDLPRIFERFYRVDKARSRSSGGTGLGLSIVKHLVELHKGTIKVDSTAGAGTSFTIELPVIQ